MCVGAANVDVTASAQPDAPPPPPPPMIDTDLHSSTKDTSAAMIPGNPVESQPAAAVVYQPSSSCTIGNPPTSTGPSQPELVAQKEVASKNASAPPIIDFAASLASPRFATPDELGPVARYDHSTPPPPPPERNESFNDSLYTANESFADLTIIEADIDVSSKKQTAPGRLASYPDPPATYAVVGADPLPPLPPPFAPASNVEHDVYATGQPPMATSSPVPLVRYVRALDTLFEELRIG